MSVLQGTTVSLSCNTTILQNSNYRLPELIWRYNGQLLNGSHPSHFHIRTHPSNSRSELIIMEVSQEDSGYYECVAFDGYHLLEGGEASYTYIIASQRAQLKIIGKFVSILYTLGGSNQGNVLLPPISPGPQSLRGSPTVTMWVVV